MRYLVTAAEMKQYDSNTIDKIGIPAMVLMERAALAAKAAVDAYVCRQTDASSIITVLVMAGVGNNGGDGLALARLLSEEGFQVEVWCVGELKRATDQWRNQWKILQNYPVEHCTTPRRMEYTIIIDALFGVGLCRPVSGVFQEALERCGHLAGYRIALDLPSGIDADTGRIWGKALKADETIAFGFCKRGLVLYPGCEWAGKVTVADIGIPGKNFQGEIPGMFAYEEDPLLLLPGRSRSGNKGTFGKVLLVAGSRNMAGAAVLAARAAYRMGAGLVKVVTCEENRLVLQTAVPEALFGTREELADGLEWADVIAIGPGLGRDGEAGDCLVQVLAEGRKPLVIDADGLNLLAADSLAQEKLADQGRNGRDVVLTPHVGELSRLTGVSIPGLKEDLAVASRALAGRLYATVAAKDARTIIGRREGPICINLSGNCGMATGGSGDVLTGIIAGLMAQGMEGFQGASVGAYLHGLAGDRASASKGEQGCMAGDIVECLGELFSRRKEQERKAHGGQIGVRDGF